MTVRVLHAKVSLNEELGERVTTLEIQVGDLMNQGFEQYGRKLNGRAKSV